MGKETKIGLAVVATLAVILAVVLIQKLSSPGVPPTTQFTGDLAGNESGSANLGDPSQPTVLETQDGLSQPALVSAGDGGEAWRTSHDEAVETPQPRTSFMPPATGDRYSAPAAGNRYSAPAPRPYDRGDWSEDEEQYEPVDPPPNDEPYDGSQEYSPYSRDEPQTIHAADVDVIPTAGEVHSHDAGHAPAAATPISSEAPQNAWRRNQYAEPSPAPIDSHDIPDAGSMPPHTQSAPSARFAAQEMPATELSEYGAATPIDVRPAMRENMETYFVEPGDNFWRIAEKIYGDGGYFKALETHNRDRFPVRGKMQVGDKVSTPSLEELREKYADYCPKLRNEPKPGTPTVSQVTTSQVRPGRPYVVGEGDTLYDIARYELGDAMRWPEIFHLNRRVLGEDIDFVRPGTRLILPAGENEDILTRQPGGTLQR